MAQAQHQAEMEPSVRAVPSAGQRHRILTELTKETKTTGKA